MRNIVYSISAMPQSSMWVPLIITFFWCLYMVWPRVDGANIPYGGLANVVPAWISMGPLVVIWVAWAVAVAILGGPTP